MLSYVSPFVGMITVLNVVIQCEINICQSSFFTFGQNQGIHQISYKKQSAAIITASCLVIGVRGMLHVSLSLYSTH